MLGSRSLVCLVAEMKNEKIVICQNIAIANVLTYFKAAFFTEAAFALLKDRTLVLSPYFLP